MRALIYGLIFLILIGIYGISSTGIQYVLAAVLIALAVMFILSKKVVPKLSGIIDYTPLIMVIIWLYGISLGLLQGNNPVFVFSNFAGMALYLIYYIFRFLDLEKLTLFKVVFVAAFVNAVYAFSGLFLEGYKYSFEEAGLGAFRVYYSAGMFVIVPVIALIVGRYVFGKNIVNIPAYFEGRLQSFLMLLFLFSSFVLLTMSKGNFLVIVAIVMLLFVSSIFKGLTEGRLVKSELLYVIFIVSFISLLFLFTPALDWMQAVFTDREASNLKRSEQYAYIMQEITFFGSGLGGVLESGYLRNESLAYGFELSYHSLLHKIGVMAIIPFLSYIYILFLATYLIVKRQNVFYPLLALGAMAYLIPSYGNPMLFSPTAVILHCLSLYWLKEKRNTNKKIAFVCD